MRDTLGFGQVNILLMALVFLDFHLISTGRSRLAGFGIGLAAAIKLTPAIFIVYLWLTARRPRGAEGSAPAGERWRAAKVATLTAIGATVLAAAVAPVESRVFWTEAIWNTDRIGSLSYISNQSLRGVLARLDPAASNLVWLLLVIPVLVIWAYRVRRAMAQRDELAGFALTAVVSCLLSPVTWVHHLVWLLPALLIILDSALREAPGSPRRRKLLWASIGSYVLVGSSMVWIWWNSTNWSSIIGGNTFVWVSLALLINMPIRQPDPVAGSTPRITRPRSAPTDRKGLADRATRGLRPAATAQPPGREKRRESVPA